MSDNFLEVINLKFLEIIIDKINHALSKMLESVLKVILLFVPEFVFLAIEKVKHFPHYLKESLPVLKTKMMILIGHVLHGIHTLKGMFLTISIYLKSDEFKKSNKKELIVKKIKEFFALPKPFVFSVLMTIFVLIFGSYFIALNTQKISEGTQKMRAPASIAEVEEDVFITIDHLHKHLSAHSAAGAAGAHGAATEEKKEEPVHNVFFQLKLELINPEMKNALEKNHHLHEIIHETVEASEVHFSTSPIEAHEKKEAEEKFLKEIRFALLEHFEKDPLKEVTLIQVFPPRPDYYRQEERMWSVEDFSVQLFFDEVKGNKQLNFDFTVVTTNRTAVMYLKENTFKVRDQLNMSMEPLPLRFPIEEEGKQIIKNKIKDEVNRVLKENNIDGAVQDVFLDHIISS